MMPDYWLEKNAGKSVGMLKLEEKLLAVSTYITYPDNQHEVLKAFLEHFVKDMWISVAVLMNDFDCGRKLKEDLIAAFEAEIQKDIDTYCALKNIPFLGEEFEAGHNPNDF